VDIFLMRTERHEAAFRQFLRGGRVEARAERLPRAAADEIGLGARGFVGLDLGLD